MSGAITISLGPDGPKIAVGPALPVEALMLGRSPEAAAELLPRIFNLCPMAQTTAMRLAFGLEPLARGTLEHEIGREHRLKLSVIWPGMLGLAVDPTGDLPDLPLPRDLDGWLARHPLFSRIAECFGPGEAVADLPALPAGAAMIPGAYDNSPAARREAHPTLAAVAARWGRGPLWRAMGRLADRGTPPAPLLLTDGTAVVPAARGTYALRGRAEHGVISAFERMTPTDHLVAPGGVLEQSLRTLPADKGRLASLLVAILDPCVPATVTEAADA
ncbi:HupK protein [Rhodobacter sp. NSM]|uniref:HupK protein n=1 Tax=Rhodobacter sp. NSM TaxID=3457501 RepID=UPI003FD2A2E6